jgi:hypothetical protein
MYDRRLSIASNGILSWRSITFPRPRETGSATYCGRARLTCRNPKLLRLVE